MLFLNAGAFLPCAFPICQAVKGAVFHKQSCRAEKSPLLIDPLLFNIFMVWIPPVWVVLGLNYNFILSNLVNQVI